jgi:hypothetical protein
VRVSVWSNGSVRFLSAVSRERARRPRRDARELYPEIMNSISVTVRKQHCNLSLRANHMERSMHAAWY